MKMPIKTYQLPKLRECFKLVDKNVVHWFPGHMGKGMKQMQQQLKSVDCVIEVHDARIPASGRNPNFKHTVLGLKPHIVVLNKKDLIPEEVVPQVEKMFLQNGISNLLFTNCKSHMCSGVKKVIPLATKLISSSQRYNRSEQKEFCMMVIGVPNVGKSSLINALRNRHLHKSNAAHVGAVAGVTRSVQTRIKVGHQPLFYLLDTPGVLTPSVTDVESGMRLALCSCLPDHLVGEEMIADYLLYMLNREQNFTYVEYLGLEQPTDVISQALVSLAQKLGRTQKIRSMEGGYAVRYDLKSAAQNFVRAFRTGELGPMFLDRDKLLT
ncbi:mitochondrial GTPase 1 [Bacillus rossius redtenbacheri]|uniref:mitochondrial GTPase 1 n=1 Tax=Bacillus rossius redtenbacheri TaxID=93214 RepID=UPI002FDC9D83